MSNIKHRFDILFTRKQVNKNLQEHVVYNSKMPLALFAIINVVLPLAFFGFIAFLIRDYIGGPMTMNITLIYIASIYLAVRSIRKRFAKRSVITRNQLNVIERDILRDIRAMNKLDDIGQKVTVNRDTRRRLRKYNMIYPTLITPSNKEIIMHKKHIKSIEKSLKIINSRLNVSFVPGPHGESLTRRKINLEKKLMYHRNAISQSNIQKSIDNFYMIQDTMAKHNPKYKHRAKTLRFKLHKLKSRKDVRDSFIGYTV